MSHRGRQVTKRSSIALLVVVLTAWSLVTSVLPSRADNLMGALDTLRTGWDANEAALSPGNVTASDFGQLFATQLDGQIYAQPVVARSTMLVVTENNNTYGLDPVTGSVKWSRNIGPAWPASAIGCGDLVPNIGITSTPVVDPATGTAYYTAKVNDGPDVDHPSWYMHAVDITTGAERPGFPTSISGSASNDPTVTFNTKTSGQRPGLLLLGGVVYAGFGSHCDYGSWVGWIVGVNASTGRQTAMWATETGSSKAGAGVWHSGGGLVSDGPNQIITATGNGVSAPPGPGTSPPGTLAESVVRLQVNSDGSLVSRDFFSPFNNTHLDTDDTDLGSGNPLGIPDGYGTSAHPHLLVQVGKDGRIFLLDRDNLGGVAQGPGGTDAVLQTLGPFKGVWGKPGFWGGDSGYVYTVPNGGPLSAYKLGASASGMPSLTQIGTSTGTFGYTSSSPVVTSDGTTQGSALVWTVYASGPSGGSGQLRAYDAVPTNGTMNLRFAVPIGTAAKFAVPATDHGRVYVGTRDGVLYAFGRPTTASLSGSPTDFGSVAVGASSTKTVTVTAQVALDVTAITTASPFSVGTTSLPRSLSAGSTLSVPVTFSPTAPGSLSGSITFTTSKGTFSFDLHGQATKDGLLSTPDHLDFANVPTSGTVTQSLSISNTGATTTTITGVTKPSAPFSSSALPVVGSTLAPGASVSVPITYAPTTTGSDSSSLVVTSSTGNVTVPLTGTAVSGASQLTITPTDVDFGSVLVGEPATKTFDISNTGNLLLTITKAAPPTAPFSVAQPVPEGQQLSPGDTLRVSVTFTPAGTGTATGSYVISSDDGTGAHTVSIHGSGVYPTGRPVIGPLGTCLDVRGANTTDGTPVQLYGCNGTQAQVWTLQGSTFQSMDKCLDVTYSGTTNGTKVQLWTCNGGGAQVWVQQPNGALLNPQSGRCLDLPGGIATYGSQLQIWDCNGTAAQAWRPAATFTSAPPGPVVGPAGKCLDDRGGSIENGSPVQIYDCNATNAQTWGVESNRTLDLSSPTRCLDAQSGGLTNGTAVQIWSCNGTGAQTWIPLANGSLLNPQSGRCLDAPNSNTANGIQLQLWDCNSTGAQTWRPAKPFTAPAPGPVNGPGSTCLDVRSRSSQDGTPVQVYGCNATPAQIWTVSADRSIQALGKCLDVTFGGVGNGTKVQLWTCNGSGAQDWVPMVDGSLVNPQSGRCLDVPAGDTTWRNQVQIWDCNATDAQQWQTPS